jgi:uncharacterized MAPEG superfamily protein
MAIAYTCLLIAALMPLFLAGYAKFSVKGYDNTNPREFLAKLEGKGKRANSAQQNAFEAFGAFAAGVIIAHLSGVDTGLISLLAVLFVIFRIIYSFCYVLDKASLRSGFWFAAFLCTISLFISAILHA